ncbi:GNAT family N-acetyltransferase [Deinococcus ruber]|uniref:N-acetyltransferase domain-containing protein n=1 Tax=Deinococcus ruber TaxID=1848197 RepID=A0A918F3F4_9DEIO|nr:GNAT family N-acetyltransferase [Deinococcus ruber]GGR03722.1 hypothetical protein GCM10008957_15810 [Deinococcus ruber]
MPETVLERIERADVQHQGLYGGEIGVFGTVAAVCTDPSLPINSALGFGRDLSNLSAVEAFYEVRHLPSRVIVYAHGQALDPLHERGYRLTLQLNVYLCLLPRASRPSPGPPPSGVQVRPAQPLEFAEVSTLGFGASSRAILERTSQRPNTALYLAEQNGQPIGAGALSVFGDVALFFSTATVPVFRSVGAQTALLARRLDDAQAAHATLATVMTTAGSPSERNVRRAGFELAGSRLSFERRPSSLPAGSSEREQ